MSPTPTNPTTLLREAASLLREAAGHATPGPWRTHDTHLGSPGGHTATVLTDRPNINDTELIAWLPTMSHEPWDETRNAWRNAGWMALMDPSVGLALADWLEAEAAAPITAQHSTRCVDPQCTTLAALTVARRVLGTPTTNTETPAPAADLPAVLREAADDLTALAAPDSERGAGVRWAADHLRHKADQAQQHTGEAHPAEHTWAAELHDPLADEWIPGRRYVTRARAVNDLEHARKIAPKWKDGAPTERRLVRATTTYTVEQPAPAVTEEPTT